MKDIKKKSNKQNYLCSWYIYKKISLFFYKVLGVGIKKVKVVSGFELEIGLQNKYIYPVLFFLSRHSMCRFNSLLDIICYEAAGFYLITYALLSVDHNVRLRLVSKTRSPGSVLSLCGIYESAAWSEREIFDFFGIFFSKNKDLRRILLDYGFKGFPLKKNYPSTGYLDTYYNDSQKRICYRKLELSQEYRHFNFKNTWAN
jgi:NADH-quinone oxidoreductase subunit C